MPSPSSLTMTWAPCRARCEISPRATGTADSGLLVTIPARGEAAPPAGPVALRGGRPGARGRAGAFAPPARRTTGCELPHELTCRRGLAAAHAGPGDKDTRHVGHAVAIVGDGIHAD